MSNTSIRQPSSKEIEEWWRWAASFADANGPFQTGIGSKFDLVPQPSFVNFFCLTCTLDMVVVILINVLYAKHCVEGFQSCTVFYRLQQVKVGSAKDSHVFANAPRRDIGKLDSNDKPSEPEVNFTVDGKPETPFYVEQEINAVVFAQDNTSTAQRGIMIFQPQVTGR